ncbi:MAG: AraC family transcriptional regulator [Bacteroidota bacterium]
MKQVYTNTYYDHFTQSYHKEIPEFVAGINYMMRFKAPLKSYTYMNNSLTITYLKQGSGQLIWKNGTKKKIKVHDNRFVVVNAECGWEYLNLFNGNLDILSLVISDEMRREFNFYAVSSDSQLLDNPFYRIDGDFFYLENALNASHFKVGQVLKAIHGKSHSKDFEWSSAMEMSFEVLKALFIDTNEVLFLAKKVNVKKKSTQIETLKRLSVAKEFIHDNLFNVISLGDISTVSSLSKHHLYNSFKRVYGQTPHQYINHYKIKKSMDYLQNGNLSVNDVASLFGFSDYSVFSKLFKKINGVAPSYYRDSF